MVTHQLQQNCTVCCKVSLLHLGILRGDACTKIQVQSPPSSNQGMLSSVVQGCSPQESSGMVIDVQEADLVVVALQNHDEGVHELPHLHIDD